MKKISIVLATIFAILMFVPLTVKATTCTGDIVNKFLGGQDLSMNQIIQLGSCTCDKIPNDEMKEDCKDAQKKLNPQRNEDGEIYYTYDFDFSKYGANYYSYVKPELNNKAYITGMRALIATVKAILSLIIGLIIFILGFGFLYNLNQMGLHSSNPQMRQECLGRIGDIFATAIFLGLIPAIMNAIVSMIQEIKW